MVVALEGLPGSGKSTSAQLLAKRLDVNAVCETTDMHPLLNEVYDDANRHDLGVELGFLLLHYAGFRHARQIGNPVTDFSPVKDRFFADVTLTPDERALFIAVYDQLYREVPLPEIVVFLDASPELCLERIRQRGRDFEAGLTLERMEQLDGVYRSRFHELGELVLQLNISETSTRNGVADELSALLESHGQ